MSLILTVHSHSDGRLFVAVVDSDIVGKEFSEGELHLDLTSSYYKGEEATEERIMMILKKAYNVNFVGDKSVSLALTSGLVDKENVLKIQGIPTAQSLVF